MTQPKYKIYLDKKIEGIGPLGAPILAVGETPGNDECIFNEPFVGSAGQILNTCLSRHGIPRESCRIDNLGQYRPWENAFENILNTPHLEYGLEKIHQYIQTYRPVVIAALGNYPMHFLTGKGKKKKGKMTGIGNWRGSILPYVDREGKIHEDIKVIPCYHPSAVNRERSLYPIFDKDIQRVAEESKFRGLKYPEREYILNPRGLVLERETQLLCNEPILSSDIETVRGTTNIISISFSPSPDKAVIISPDDPSAMVAVGKILQANNKKIFHFGNFDSTQLRLNGYEMGRSPDCISLDRLYYFDTYLAAHILNPELPKTLAFETSIRTREPYYKHEGKEGTDQKGWGKKTNRDVLFKYNGKDTCVDFEIYLQQADDIAQLSSEEQAIFNFEMSQIEMQQHISMSGMLIDPARLELFKQAMIARWIKLQIPLDGLAGFEVNARSPKLKDWLYGKDSDGGLGLPTRYYQKKVTTNDDALVSLIAWCQDKMNTSVKDDTKRKYKMRLLIIKSMREIREIRQRLSMYVLSKQSSDGRSRSLYKNGPETGRWAASKFVDGTGYNHQTNPRDPVEVLDEEFEKYKNNMTLLDTLEPTLDEEEDDD